VNKLSSKQSLKTMLGVSLMTVALGLSACNSVNSDVKARQDGMKSWSDAMGVMGDMVKAPDTFDAAVFKEQSGYLAADSSTIWTHFKEADAESHALDAVWSNADGFAAEADNFKKVSAELYEAAQSAGSITGVAPAFKEVGASCKSCHTDFKVKSDK